MTINRRTADGWVKQQNADPRYCDECNRQLWEAPHGGLYCNTNMCGTDYQFFSKRR